MKCIRKCYKMLSVAVAAVLLFGLSATKVYANYYGIAQNSQGGDGSYFYATIKSLDADWSASTPYNFILHTTWVGSGDKWIENGFMDGAIQEPGGNLEYYHGFYTATGSHDGSIAYSEYKIVDENISTSDETSHCFQIQRDGTSKWGVYVDYKLCRSYSDFATSCDSIDVGLETNTTTSSSEQWNERSFERLTSNGWEDWTSASLYNSGSGINVSWATKYTAIYTSKSDPRNVSMEEDEEDVMHADSMSLMKNPDPVLVGNSEILASLQNSRINTIAEYKLDSTGGEVIMNEYMTYADFLEMEGSIENVSTEIAMDRVIFVAKVFYPDGFNHVRGGFIDNCLATGIYDAETGEYLGGSFATVSE